MEFFTYIFGQAGLLNQFLGGYWFIVPFFLMAVFLIYLYVNRVSTDNIMIFTVTGLLLFTIDDLFDIPTEWTIAIIMMIIFIVATYAYTILNK